MAQVDNPCVRVSFVIDAFASACLDGVVFRDPARNTASGQLDSRTMSFVR
jgi:hypothetical protein